jgi:glycerol-1-phosphate dehydrogenase [NAD(P)+]
MKIQYDPGENEKFWEKIARIPGYPTGDKINLRAMLFESDAVFKLSELFKSLGIRPTQPILVVMDPVHMQRNGADLKKLVIQSLQAKGWQVEPCILAPDPTGQVHTDMPHIHDVKQVLRADTAALALGSGVVTDITKHACFLYEQETGTHIPFVAFQTANSVSAFTSNMAPVFVDGVKRTLPSRYPDALVCDLETLRDAPMEMTVAGVGDLLAAFISLPDWRLANVLGMDPGYNGFPQELMGPIDQIFLAEAEGIRTGNLESVAVLAKLIALGGLAMSLAHATTPMSGFEHVMSHVLDLENELSGRPLAMHGTQVAMTSIVGAHIYQKFLNEFDPRQLKIEACYPDAEAMRKTILASYAQIDPSGKAGEECWSDYRLKIEEWPRHKAELQAFAANWQAVKSELAATTRPPETIRDILSAIRSPYTFDELKPAFDEPGARFAFLNASLMRKRLTVGDLLIFFKWDREALWNEIWKRSQTHEEK